MQFQQRLFSRNLALWIRGCWLEGVIFATGSIKTLTIDVARAGKDKTLDPCRKGGVCQSQSTIFIGRPDSLLVSASEKGCQMNDGLDPCNSRSESLWLAQISHDRLDSQLVESLSLFRSANEKTYVISTLQQTGYEVTSHLTSCPSNKNGFHDHLTPYE
jgi:hypothetical protein